MPAVSLPQQQQFDQQQLHGNVILNLISTVQVRRLLQTAAALLALVVLTAALLRSSWNYKLPSLSLPKVLEPPAAKQRRLWPLEKSRGVSTRSSTMSANQTQGASPLEGDGVPTPRQAGDRRDGSRESSSPRDSTEDMPIPSSVGASQQHSLKPRRPSPPPPLTPPTSSNLTSGLSTSKLVLHDRRPSVAASSIGDLESALPHHAHASTSVSPIRSASTGVSDPHAAPVMHKRKSYTAIITPGPAAQPIPVDRSSGHDTTTTTAPSRSFSPSSFPSSGPTLPLAPHDALEGEAETQTEARGVSVYGEVLSVVDEASGAGEDKHTNVFEGGPCAECQARKEGEGGYYGKSVPLHERR
ncbi:hypothetical protein F5Y15DRAFT_198724 [Xylariaceae sp. FL0016]|nr:hypothetical protein F5Y15DRAFT_198724 [Xylariaceae sp. FL0016]